MSNEAIPDSVIERLRNNLRAAAIPVSEADIQGMLEKGFLQTVVEFEQLEKSAPTDLLPDYLKAWGEGEEAQATSLTDTQNSGPITTGKSASGYTTITEIARSIKAREISPVELTEQALSRIAERDTILNAFQLVTADYARQKARQAEQEIAAGQYRGPLHGVPVAVKDLLAMAGTVTTAGSKIFGQQVTDYNSAGVERLEAAGAVIVGKTRMSEFAYSPGSNNGHYGPTRNPRNLDYDTGGSSSGSGAAVAEGLVYGALGTDTGGSIRIPSSQCGIVGLKPTFGRVSLYGGTTLAWSLDHLGPMTHSVIDAALMLQPLAGYDARDIRTRRVAVPGYTAGIEGGVKGLRIGAVGQYRPGQPLATPEAISAWRKGLETLARNGAELVEFDLPEFYEAWVVNRVIIALEAVAFHEPFLRERLNDYGEFMRQRVLYSYAFSPGTFVRVQQLRQSLRARFNALFSRIDLLSTPTMPGGAPLLGTPGSTALTGPFNLLGWPTISVPVGKTAAEGLPLGLQLAGKPWDEATVLRAARVIEAEG
jgi:aspartyl-tRNA(Asn)/glutamyl-tRNA(Gln) amidotransferase subunit A